MSADERVDVYLPLYVRDFLTSTIGWSAEERGHYLTLLMLQWDRDGLPAELDLLEKLSPGIGSVWHVLRDKFPVEQDGMRRNQRLEEHRARAVELRKKRSEAGRAGASARFAQANAQQTHGNRMANVKHPPSPSPSTSPSESSAVAEDVSQQAAPVVAPSDPPRRRNRSRPKDAICWDCDGGWQGITDADRSTWATAFPACTLNIELVRAAEWLRANPTKARKSNWRRFLVSWLTRSQDKGGTIRSAGKTPEDMAKRAHVERKAREFADYQPAPYRRPKEVAALADGLKLKEDA